MYGADRYDSGEVIVKGKKMNIKTPEQGKKAGIALLTEDRKNQGLILGFDLTWNVSLTNLDRFMGPFGLDLAKEQKVCKELADSMRTKTPSMKQLARNLSGGNQ